jgi:hypothetical protein
MSCSAERGRDLPHVFNVFLLVLDLFAGQRV